MTQMTLLWRYLVIANDSSLHYLDKQITSNILLHHPLTSGVVTVVQVMAPRPCVAG